MKNKIIIITIITLFLDQVIKFICNLYLHNNVNIIPGILSLTYAENNGIAFSMLSGNRMFIVLISIVIIVFLVLFLYKDFILKKEISLFKELTFGILLGGILGNLIDRITRGVVIDYVSIKIFSYNFPIFNLADVAITIGVILISLYYLKNDSKDKKIL